MNAITSPSAAMPSIIDLGQHVRALWDQYEAPDRAALEGVQPTREPHI